MADIIDLQFKEVKLTTVIKHFYKIAKKVEEDEIFTKLRGAVMVVWDEENNLSYLVDYDLPAKTIEITGALETAKAMILNPDQDDAHYED